KASKTKGKTKEKAPPKPKRAPVPPRISPDDLTLEQALLFGSLPRVIGVEPDSGTEIVANIGRFGPYIKLKDQFISVKKDYDIYTLSLEDALKIIEINKNKEKKKPATAKPTAAKPIKKEAPSKKGKK
ncbi:MAG: hypothetical protein F9K49_02795, partial [Caedimonadaceae bacterium]